MLRRTLCITLLAAFAGLTAFAAATGPAPGGTKVKGAKPAHIAKGEKVTLADYIVPGKITIFDFYSDYCPPCVRISPELEKLHARRADVVVVKVDINRPGKKTIDWSSPVAQQYRLEAVPHFKIYGKDGKLQSEGEPAFRSVIEWISQGS